MRYLKHRRILPHYYDANTERPRIVESHRVKRCGTCTYEVPEADIVIEDGREVCPMCLDLYTAQWLAEEQNDVARVKMDSARGLVDPPQFSIRSLAESSPGAVTLITDSIGRALSQTSPLTLPRNVATTVLLVGQHFTSAMTITYEQPAAKGTITNNVAPIITPSLITLSVLLTPTGGLLQVLPTGQYGITIGDGVTQLGHIYPGIFSVR